MYRKFKVITNLHFTYLLTKEAKSLSPIQKNSSFLFARWQQQFAIAYFDSGFDLHYLPFP